MHRGDAAPPERDPVTDERSPFLITIDTEGDDLWSRPQDITARNAEALPRFQELCERYGLKPTYLTNWEMAESAAFVDFGQAVLAKGTAEIGMHLHAWNSPPISPLTSDDYRYQPYLLEYPRALIGEKVRVMTDTLESTFGVKMRSHRAGRWGLDETYARVLSDAGYDSDCSVTPHVDWRAHPGDPAGNGGPDFRAFPEVAYFMDPDDISRPGASSLLQVPMTIVTRNQSTIARGLRATAGKAPYVRRVVRRALPAHTWLRPNGRNRSDLLRALSIAQDEGRDYVEFMIHSSELMAGGSPTFPSPEDIDALYDDLEALFDHSTDHWVGRTISEYRDTFPAVGGAGATGSAA